MDIARPDQSRKRRRRRIIFSVAGLAVLALITIGLSRLQPVAPLVENAWPYTVKRGDALSSIAARWNTTPDHLRQWNNIEGNRIRVGQALLVKPKLNESVVAGEVGNGKK